MDPITATIIAGLLWLVLGSLANVFIYLLVAFLVGLIVKAVSDSDEASVGLGVFFGWVAAVVWEIFVLFQVVIHVVRLIQLATGSPVTV